MSSMRNAVHRRQHRERAQPGFREKWGLLEKHKDYTHRARDYNLKQEKLKRLRDKARNKHPDEFAFGMISRRQGHHGARDPAAGTLSVEAVKLLKTQDAGYLRVVGERVRRQLDGVSRDVRLQEGIAAALENGSAPAKGRSGKVIFVDSVEEQRRRVMEGRSHIANDGEASDEDMDTENNDENNENDEEVADDDGFVNKGAKLNATNGTEATKGKSKKQIEVERLAVKQMLNTRRLKKRATESRLKKLEALGKQHKEIRAAQDQLDWQRARMENSVGGVNKYGIKWKIRERKK